MKTIIFDVDGVIVSMNFEAIFSNFAKRTGLALDFVINYHRTNMVDLLLGKMTLSKFWADMRNASNNPNLDFETIWIEEGIKNTKINKGLLKIVKKLKESGYSAGILSNCTESRILIDKTLGIYRYFDNVVLSCREKLKKPDPAFYRLALSRAHAKPSEAIFVDDKKFCTDGAEKVGMKSILYTYPDNVKLSEDLNKLGVPI